jgi:2',3'-cyclic-nucleotide 2'-phosphodiesterase (5'-nucleotidase family)
MDIRFRFLPHFTFPQLSVVTSLSVAAALLPGCASAPPLNPVPVAAVNKTPLNVKIIAFNDFHGNLKTPSLTIRVPDATQPTGSRMEPAGDMVGATPFLSIVMPIRWLRSVNIDSVLQGCIALL